MRAQGKTDESRSFRLKAEGKRERERERGKSSQYLVAAMEVHGREIAGPACNSVSNRSKYVYELLHKEREPCGEITA